MKTTAKLLLTVTLMSLAVTLKAQDASPLAEAREAIARYEYSRAIELLDKALESAKDA